MIVYRMWIKERDGYTFLPDKRELQHYAHFEGWFLFGIIPLLVKQTTRWGRET